MELREARKYVELIERDKLVRRRKKIRAEVVLEINTIKHWNRLHPDQPIDDSEFVAVLKYLDGEGPMPELSKG